MHPRYVAPALALLIAGCASTSSLLEERRYFEACRRLQHEFASEREPLERALAADLRGEVHLHVLDAAEIEHGTGVAPALYGPSELGGGRWVVAVTTELSHAPRDSIHVGAHALLHGDFARERTPDDTIASNIFGIDPRPSGVERVGEVLETITFGWAKARTVPIEDPSKGTARRDAADALQLYGATLTPTGATTSHSFFNAYTAAEHLEKITAYLQFELRDPEGAETCFESVFFVVPLRPGATFEERVEGATLTLPVQRTGR